MFVSMRLYNLQLMGSLETISLEYWIGEKKGKDWSRDGSDARYKYIYNGNGNGPCSGGGGGTGGIVKE